MGGGVELSVVSNKSEDDFTSDWVGITGITGGGDNNHLSSLRNAWGECRAVTGGVFSPSAKGSSGVSGEGSTGRKGSLGCLSCRSHYQVLISPANNPC